MRKLQTYSLVLLSLLLLSLPLSCDYGEELNTTPEATFDALWKIIDENYCFFEYKNVDWNEVRTRYRARIRPSMGKESLFNLLGEMLAELKDGHTNLYSASNVARYWSWFEDYPINFDANIQRNYLKTDYLISSGLRYTILDDNIGYIYYPSFSSAVGAGNIDLVLNYFRLCNGIIIDVRNNGGGNLTYVDILAAPFTNERVLAGYITHKTGKAHNAFSDPYPKYLSPSPYTRWQKRVVVLTNRSSYSATNDFVAVMKRLPNVTVIGDRTGGGSGLPFSSELPNGWSVRFSSSPMLDPDKKHLEFGVDPHISVDMQPQDTARGLDTIIEAARAFINKK